MKKSVTELSAAHCFAHIHNILDISYFLHSADLSDLCLGYADLVEPHKLLVPLPPVADWGIDRLHRPLTPVLPQVTCILEERLQIC